MRERQQTCEKYNYCQTPTAIVSAATTTGAPTACTIGTAPPISPIISLLSNTRPLAIYRSCRRHRWAIRTTASGSHEPTPTSGWICGASAESAGAACHAGEVAAANGDGAVGKFGGVPAVGDERSQWTKWTIAPSEPPETRIRCTGCHARLWRAKCQ